MAHNIQLIVTGVGVGCVYALVALGFVMIFRATNVVNFAQGEFSMVAAFALTVVLGVAGLPYWLALIVVIVGMCLFGVLFQAGVYYPLRKRSYLPVIISTLGASIFLQNGAVYLFGPQPRRLESILEWQGLRVGDVFLSSQYLLIIGVTLVLVIAQHFFFERTMLGKMLQATSQDKDMARMLGISARNTTAVTFAYSAALGGIAGVLVGPIIFTSAHMGAGIALSAFAATIIGGFGNVAGAVVGGIVIGVVNAFGSAYISVAFNEAYGFIVLLLFLLIRPQGIFGEKIGQKV